jgi:hypothetical protein
MTATQAASLLNRMLGSYPSLNLHDPKIYMANLTALMAQYPLWVGERAIVEVRRATEYLPTEKIVREALEGQISAHRFAAEWNKGAALIADDRKRLAAPARPSYDDLKAKHGPAWGVRNPDEATKPKPPTLEEVRAKYGAALVDAVPDATAWDWQKLHHA